MKMTMDERQRLAIQLIKAIADYEEWNFNLERFGEDQIPMINDLASLLERYKRKLYE